MTFGQQQTHASRVHNALLHGEPLLIVATRDFENVAFEVRSQAITGHFVAHTVLHEGPEPALVVDLNKFLRAIGRVGDIELHVGD